MSNNMYEEKSSPMLSQAQIEKLRLPFPDEALSADWSRGFELTSIKAAYVIERLNEVFGLCGVGWRFVHSPFEFFETLEEVVTEVALQYRLDEDNSPAVEWCEAVKGWTYHEGGSKKWSEPVYACGGKSIGKGGAAYTDARKSAVTDGLTKAASMLGVAHQVFKGWVRVGHRSEGNNGGGNEDQPGYDEANSTAFWTVYNSEAKSTGITRQDAKKVIDYSNWNKSIADLRVLINKTQQAAVR